MFFFTVLGMQCKICRYGSGIPSYFAQMSGKKIRSTNKSTRNVIAAVADKIVWHPPPSANSVLPSWKSLAVPFHPGACIKFFEWLRVDHRRREHCDGGDPPSPHPTM
jgi:hypothetical protein